MYDQILFPTDGSEAATGVLDHVLDLAVRHGSTLHVLNVADTGRDSVTRVGIDVVDALEQAGETVVEETAARVADRNVDVVEAVEQGPRSTTIVEYADANDVDLVAMATHGRRGLDRLLLGSVTERVVRLAGVPVLTIRPDDDAVLRHPYQSVLVPTDGSDVAAAALDEGIEVADAYDATLHVLSVVDPVILGYDVYSALHAEDLEDRAREIVDTASDAAEQAGVGSVTGTVAFGRIRSEIRSYVDDNDVDLVVMGTHGREGVDRLLLGSVTEAILRTSPVPVLTVRGETAGGRDVDA